MATALTAAKSGTSKLSRAGTLNTQAMSNSRIAQMALKVSSSTSDEKKPKKKKSNSSIRKSNKKGNENFWGEIGRYASTLAGSGNDEPEDETNTEKDVMLPTEKAGGGDEVGTDRLQRVLKTFVESKEYDKVWGVAKKDPSAMEQDMIMRVALEDEWQLMSCGSLPFTIIYFLIFMIFFQNHYSTVQIFLAENNFRHEVSDHAQLLSEGMQIYDWLEELAIPYLWGTKRADGVFNTDSPALYQEVVAGILFTTTRASAAPCTYSVASHMDCYNHNPETLEGTAFGYEPGRRLGSGKLAAANGTSSSLLPEGYGRQAALRPAPDVRGKLDRGGVKAPGCGRRPSGRSAKPLRSLRGVVEESSGWASNGTRASLRTFQQRLAEHRRKRQEADCERRLRDARSELMDALPSGGGMESSEIVLPVSMTFTEAMQEMQRWKDVRLIEMRTMTLNVEALILNEHVSTSFQTLSKIEILFKFSRGGMLFARVNIVTLTLGASFEGASVLVGPLWVVCLVAFSCTLPNRATEKWEDGPAACVANFFKFWNITEWVITVGGWMIIMMFIVERAQNNVVKRGLDEYKTERVELPPEEWERLDLDAFTELNDKASRAALTSMWMVVIVANYHLILVFRFFMASRGQPRLAVVLSTIRKASGDLIHLFIVFLIIILAYVIGGHMLFGRRMQEFATISSSFAAVIQIVTEREFQWERFTQEDVYTATAWVWSFLVLSVLVLVNIFLAMIFDSYSEVHAAVGDSVSFWQTSKRFLAQARTKIRNNKHDVKWVANKDIVHAIRKMRCAEVTPWMLKDAFPAISNNQVNYIFNLAKKRQEWVALRKNQSNHAEVLSSMLLGIEKMHIGLKTMRRELWSAGQLPEEEGPPNAVETDPVVDASAVVADGCEGAFAKAALIDPPLARLTSPPPPKTRRFGTPAPPKPPHWIKMQLQPHFRKQQEMLAEALSQMRLIDQELRDASCGLAPPPDTPPEAFCAHEITTPHGTPRTPNEPLTPVSPRSPRSPRSPKPPSLMPSAVRRGLTQEGLATEDFPPADVVLQMLPSATRTPLVELVEGGTARRAFVDLRSGVPKEPPGFGGRGGGMAGLCACAPPR